MSAVSAPDASVFPGLDAWLSVDWTTDVHRASALRGAGWVETPQGWRAGSAAPLPLAEAYAELRRQMRSEP